MKEKKKKLDSEMTIFNERKKKSCQPRNLFLAKTPFENESEIKIFSDKSWGNFSVVELHYNKC